MQKRTWSQEQIEQIIYWYNKKGYSIKYIAKTLLKCRESSVSSILKENGIKLTNGRTIERGKEKEIIELYLNKKLDINQIAKRFSCSCCVISNILKRNNIETISHPRINKRQKEDYFRNIDTEHKAYWLGFIFSDGNIYKNRLTIEIQERDVELLERFKKDLCLNSKIITRHRENTTVCSIQMTSASLCKDLENYGIVPNKTLITKHLPTIPVELLPHFLRGLIDGDGWITLDKNGRYHIGFVSNYVSTCEDFKNYCNIVTNGLCIANISYKDKENKTPCFQIQSKEAVKRLAIALYQTNTICLERKYRLVEPLFTLNDEDIV